MRIAIVNTHFNMGGIRQSLLNLLYGLKETENEIDLYILDGREEDIKKYIRELRVNNLIILKKTSIFYRRLSNQDNCKDTIAKLVYGSLSKVIGRESVIRHIINTEELPLKDYDVVVSYSNGIWTYGSKRFTGGCEYVAYRLKGKRKYAWIHSNPEKLGFTNSICTRMYSKFDKIVNVSFGCKEIFDRICPELKEKSVVIYNLCGSDKVHTKMNESNPYTNTFNIVSVARLDNKSKRLDRLAQCCKILKGEGYSFKWHIVGGGDDMPLLKCLIDEKEIGDVLIVEGKKDNPYPYMKYADLYVCTSDYEAFSLVIRESFLCGTPVVTTPISPAKEVIDNNKSGLICDDFEEQTMVNTIRFLMDNPKELEKMRAYISDNSREYEDDIEPFIKLCEER